MSNPRGLWTLRCRLRKSVIMKVVGTGRVRPSREGRKEAESFQKELKIDLVILMAHSVASPLQVKLRPLIRN